MLAEALEAYRESKVSQVKRCAVGAWRDSLDITDQKELDGALVSDIPSVSLHTIISSLGADFSLTLFRSHRSGVCACQN